MNQPSYNWDADDYNEHSQAQYEWAKDLICKLQLKGTESVLDIGCGDGKVTKLLHSYIPKGEVMGIDSSYNMIALARKNFPPIKYPNLKFSQMDATQINFKKQFDIIFSNAALHWIKDHRSLLKNVKKSLKESGKILFQMGGKGNAQETIDAVNEVINKNKWKRYFNNFAFPYTFYSDKEYIQMLNTVGLKPKRVELLPKIMTHNGKEGMIGWIRSTWLPFTERIPEDQRDSFIEQVVYSYLKQHPIDDDGLIRVKMMRLEVEAVKR